MKLAICLIVSAILFTHTVGAFREFRHDIRDHGGYGWTVEHLAIGFFFLDCNVPPAYRGLKYKKGKRDVRLGKKVLNHSMVYFRGKTYEFGANSLVLHEGGIGRTNPRSCPTVKRSWAGRSVCSQEQATDLAVWYQQNHNYNFFTENCHNFAEWLINRLLNNHCTR